MLADCNIGRLIDLLTDDLIVDCVDPNGRVIWNGSEPRFH